MAISTKYASKLLLAMMSNEFFIKDFDCEMTDREKVIKGLEEALDILRKTEEPTFWLEYVKNAVVHALELLKEQEPRVMTLDQIKGITDGVVWVELNGREAVEPWIVLQGEIWRPDYNTGYECWEVCQENEYNMIIRCWSSEPTEKQRRAVKWDG